MKVFFDESGKRIDIDLSKEKVNTYLGIINTKDLKKAKHGETITTSAGKKIIVLEANFVDKFENIKRGPQIIDLKDAAIIVAYTGISSGYKVVEAGSGSGALTSYLANLVKPDGKVYSYEKRSDFLKIAKENVKMFGLSKYVKFKNKNTHKGINEKNVDVVIFDMPDPWHSLKHAEKALKVGGFLVCYLPNLSQVEELLQAAKETSLKLVKLSKVILKDANEKMKFKPKIKRNSYLVFLRKLPLLDR
ncbi:MAG: methyltransferase domain-containing protein [Nanoarchaeota archaeon]|nr:methyltransferase domain-containing protein [Nanoarchaeota archaeon]